MSYVRKIQRNGASIVCPTDNQRPPWIPHRDPALLAWMSEMGYTSVEDIPVVADYRPEERCERCGDQGVETHHTAPREWFGVKLAETYPLVELCRPCHELWHAVARVGAATQWSKQARMRGLTAVAEAMENGLEQEIARVRRLAAADARRRAIIAGREPAA